MRFLSRFLRLRWRQWWGQVRWHVRWHLRGSFFLFLFWGLLLVHRIGAYFWDMHGHWWVRSHGSPIAAQLHVRVRRVVGHPAGQRRCVRRGGGGVGVVERRVRGQAQVVMVVVQMAEWERRGGGQPPCVLHVHHAVQLMAGTVHWAPLAWHVEVRALGAPFIVALGVVNINHAIKPVAGAEPRFLGHRQIEIGALATVPELTLWVMNINHAVNLVRCTEASSFLAPDVEVWSFDATKIFTLGVVNVYHSIKLV
mmetsp:Transcript_11344/g.18159  ORF Transcript_11344/g.18159 Transcript_11344/m.18159 type:complete len:253 (+) Transcript_11344:662-1420(+)